MACRLAQARTGTGKTLAFLIPVLQNIITYDRSLELRKPYRDRASPTDIRAIIISPTRELAEQIAVEARKITKNTGVVVQTAVGGSSKREGLQKIKREGCHILIGTPGRLNDLLSDPYSQVRAPKLNAFVLDEADRLLDQGFAPEIKAIQDLLPDRREHDRQTLLFSATVPREVMQIVRKTTKPNFKFIRTVQEGEQQTHEKVTQKVVRVAGFENFLPALIELTKRELKEEDGLPFKAIVYFNATAEVTLATSTLYRLRNPALSGSYGTLHPLYPAKIIQIHAKLSQEQRTRAANDFRRAKHAIMLSSDVTARGMDFPNVTHVIQMGIPTSRDTYIHRVGRTARGDKEGEGWLFLTDLETKEARHRLHGLPLQPDTSLQTSAVDMTKDASLPESTAKILTQVVEATKDVRPAEKSAAYMASIGIYAWVTNKQELMDAMNNRARYCWGMDLPPPVPKILVTRLGFGHVQGINIAANRPRDLDDHADRGDSRSSGYGRGGHGGGNGYGSFRGRGGVGGERRSGYGGSSSSDRYGNAPRSGGYGSREGRAGGYGGGYSRGVAEGGRGSYGGGGRGSFRGGSRGSYEGKSSRDVGGSGGGYRDSYGGRRGI